MADIHSSAVIHPEAKIADSASIGPFCFIGAKATIGENVVLHSSVTVMGETTLHNGCEIFHGAAIGTRPQVLGAKPFDNKTEIGARTVLREFVSVRGASEGKAHPTRIGEDCFLMVNSHIGHDVQIGNKCVFSPNVMIGGHAIVGHQVWMGGGAGVHQNTWIGDHAFIAAGCMLTGDVVPFMVAKGTESKLASLNGVGLSRRGFSRADMQQIRKAVHFVLASDDGQLKDRLAAATIEFKDQPLAMQVIDFLNAPRAGRKICTFRK